MRIWSFTSLSLFLFFSRADALYGYELLRWQLTSPDDVTYALQIYFNEVFQGQYNSTLGKCVGYTKKGEELAEILNQDRRFLDHQKRNEERGKAIIESVWGLFTQPVKPEVSLRSVKAAEGKHPGILVCSVYNFYPKQIRVTWLRNGEKVTSDVTSTDVLPNGNWLNQLHSQMEYIPQPGEKIECKVEHASLRKPELYEWVSEPTSDSARNKIAVGTAGLLIGVVFFGAGLFTARGTLVGESWCQQIKIC